MTTTALGPHFNPARESGGWAWEKFHKLIAVRDNEALSKVITSLTDILDGLGSTDNTLVNKYLGEYRTESDALRKTMGFADDWRIRVTSGKIIDHFKAVYDSHKPESDLMRYGWNFTKNMIRVLESYRDNLPMELLLREDVEIAEEFLQRLKHPPVKYP